MKALDYQEPYLKALLGVIGPTNISFVRAEGAAMGPKGASTAIANCRSAGGGRRPDAGLIEKELQCRFNSQN
jgi:hypothetical protein